MNIEVYGKPDCPFCSLAKDLLNRKGLHYSEHVAGSDMTREEFFEKFPGARTVPQITIDGRLIGGYDKLTEWMNSYDNSKFLAG